GWTGTSGDSGGAQGNFLKVGNIDASSNFYYTGLVTQRWRINSNTSTTGSSSQPYENNTILNSYHSGGIQVLMGDGSGRYIAESIDMETFRRLCAANDGQVVGEF